MAHRPVTLLKCVRTQWVSQRDNIKVITPVWGNWAGQGTEGGVVSGHQRACGVGVGGSHPCPLDSLTTLRFSSLDSTTCRQLMNSVRLQPICSVGGSPYT